MPTLTPAGVAALQRSAGNAAVARLLGSAAAQRTLQRKIGFELEAGRWRAHLLDRAPTEEERRDGKVKKGEATKPPDARQAFHDPGAIRGTADELPNGVRDVEYVIKPLDETKPRDIDAAFEQVHAAFKSMQAKLPAAHYLWPERQLGWAPPDAGVWLIDDPAGGEPVVQLQATAGLPLDQLADMMLRSHPTVAVPAADDPKRQTSIHPSAGEDLGIAASAADDALSAFSSLDPVDLGNVGKLRGLLSLMALILIGGTTSDPAAEGPSYPKAIAHILARTDFAHLFASLPKAQRATLKANDPNGQPRFVSLIELMCFRSGIGLLDTPVFQWVNWKQIPVGKLLPDLTRRAWADGLLSDRDRLSRAGYEAWLEQRHQAQEVTDSEHGERKEQAKQLDSLGSRGGRMDPRGLDPLPLFEFRALVNKTESPQMTIAEAKEIALRLSAYIARMTGLGVR